MRSLSTPAAISTDEMDEVNEVDKVDDQLNQHNP